MKFIKSILVLSLTVITHSLSAQNVQPQKVNSIARDWQPCEWYAEQYLAWEKEITKRKKDPSAWLNYFTAARTVRRWCPGDKTEEEWDQKLETIVSDMKKNIPNTFEYWFIQAKWVAGRGPIVDDNGKDKTFEYALKAFETDPTRPESYDLLIIPYITSGNKEKITEISKRWIESGDITYSLFAYNYNTLIGADDNAIIFTNGDNDTFPAWVLQYGLGIKRDITIMNIYLTHGNKDFRERVFKQANIPPMANEPADQKEVIEHVIKNLGDRSLYFASTFNFENFGELEEKIYNIGVGFIYCENDFNNNSYIIQNFENKYLLDHLKSGMTHETFPALAKNFNMGYISSLFRLLEHYVITEQLTKAEETKKMISTISKGTEYEESIAQSLEQF